MALAFARGPVVWREDFAYTDAASIDGTGGWVAPGISGDVAMGVAGGALQRTAGSGWSAAITSHQGFRRAPGIDFVFEIAATPDGTNQVFAIVLGGGPGAGTTGYVANINMSAGNSRWRLQRFSNGSNSATHVDASDAVLAAGDALGLRCLPGVVAMWRRVGGAWSQVGAAAADATFAAGSVGVETNAGATRIDAITAHRAVPALASVGCGS